MSDTEARVRALDDVLNEISAALVELVDLAEKNGKDGKTIGQMIAKAIGGIEPKIVVNPTPVVVQNSERPQTDWRFEPEYDPVTGLLKCLYAYRM